MTTRTRSKNLIRVTIWTGTNQATRKVSTYKQAMAYVALFHRNSYAPTFEEIATGRTLVDDGNGLCVEDQSYYVG